MPTDNEQIQVQPQTQVEKKEPRTIPLKGKRIAVGHGGNVGYWNGYGWDNQNNLGDWSLKQITFDLSGQMWCVGTGNNVGKYDPTKNKMTYMGNLGSWSINSIAFDIDGKLWAVGTGGHVGVWDGSKMKLQGNNGLLGDWTLKYLAFDHSGRIWCVGTGSNVGIYNPTTKKMDDKGFLGDWAINSIAFELDGPMYVVGTGGNVGTWNGSKLESQDFLGDWAISCLDFNYPMEVLSVNYDFAKMRKKTSTESTGSTTWYKNGTKTEQETQLAISAEKKSTHTFSWQNETTVGISMTSEVNVPLVGKSEIELSVSNTYTFGETETNEHTQSWEWTNVVKAPPCSQVRAVAQLNRADVEVPFVATVRYRGQTTERHGTFKGSDYFNMDITVEQDPYPCD